MKKLILNSLIGYSFLMSGTAFPDEVIEGIYTETSGANCKTIDTDPETGATSRRCLGPFAYDLIIDYDDDRENVRVVTPNGKEYDADFYRVVTSFFSSVGRQAEWRVNRDADNKIIALILQVDSINYTDQGDATPISYFVVIKITGESICATHRFKVDENAMDQARNAADVATMYRCLSNLADR